MRHKILLLLLLLTAPAIANQQARDFSAGATMLVLDWAQTRHIARNPQRFHEAYNPVLDSHPSTGQVDRYFIGAMLLHGAAYKFLPARHKGTYLRVFAVVQGGAVHNNLQLGIKTEW